ncbi:hypothetical protein GGR16_002418 [Chelatococcus caeni]|uniref:Bacteriophage protein n=1 Tax=Chelatococcus caeni TaxID=1348468 RepID=A0A840C1L6_9HYPH|nr:hypothetical protein [Chelatococcus caeni]MBB4017389.1 hypothetical protein [Chelatococcus caeni]
MAKQWLREIRLKVGSNSQEIDVSQMRIKFVVRHWELQTPAHSDIIIYNLSDETANRIKKEFTTVSLEAGYRENFGLIFRGEVKQIRKGRENPVDTYLAILAANADRAYNYAVVNKTLAAGHTFRDQVETCIQAMKPYGVQVGHIADLGSQKMPRAASLFGMARDVLRRVCFATNMSWSIQNDRLQIVPNREAAPGEAIVLNSRTGMIGLPVQTIDGILVRCLLNPQIVPGKRVKIDQASVQEARFNPSFTAEVHNAMIPSTADDGLYKVLAVDHIGDTRGQPWYSDLTCIRADGQGPLPLGLAQRGIALDPEQS